MPTLALRTTVHQREHDAETRRPVLRLVEVVTDPVELDEASERAVARVHAARVALASLDPRTRAIAEAELEPCDDEAREIRRAIAVARWKRDRR